MKIYSPAGICFVLELSILLSFQHVFDHPFQRNDFEEDSPADGTDECVRQEGDDKKPEGNGFGIEDEGGQRVGNQSAQYARTKNFPDDGAPDGPGLLIQDSRKAGADHAARISQDGADSQGDADRRNTESTGNRIAPSQQDGQKDIDEMLQGKDPGTSEGKRYERSQKDAESDKNSCKGEFFQVYILIIHRNSGPFHR